MAQSQLLQLIGHTWLLGQSALPLHQGQGMMMDVCVLGREHRRSQVGQTLEELLHRGTTVLEYRALAESWDDDARMG